MIEITKTCFNKGFISISENRSGKIYVEFTGIQPTLIFRNTGQPGINGPDLEFDSVQLINQENKEAKIAAKA